METVKEHQKLKLFINIVSVALPLLVAGMFQFKLTDFQWSFDVYWLPFVNAILNGTSAVLLIGALIAVKQKNIKAHAAMIYAAMLMSLLFLLVYVAYHITAGHTKFGGEGTIKLVYLLILASHIILAAIQAPLVLYAFLYGYTGQLEKHKKIVKFSYPIWLYVSITGVICYLMIAPYYP